MVQGRRHIPGDIELRVLNRSRRRCALCFQLNGDLTEKYGQIANVKIYHWPAALTTMRQSKKLLGNLRTRRTPSFAAIFHKFTVCVF